MYVRHCILYLKFNRREQYVKKEILSNVRIYTEETDKSNRKYIFC